MRSYTSRLAFITTQGVVISGKPNLSVGEERSSVDVRGKMTLTVAHAAGNSVSQTTVMVDMMS
jgi:hypothetical protein